MIGAFIAAAAAVSTIMKAEEEKGILADEYDAAVRNAQIAKAGGRYNMMRQQQQAQQVIGSMKADYAASGVSSDSGSVLDVIRASTINAEMERLNIKYGADVAASEYMARGNAARSAAGSIAVNAPIRAGVAAFGGYASAYRGGGGDNAPQTSLLNTPSSGGAYTMRRAP